LKVENRELKVENEKIKKLNAEILFDKKQTEYIRHLILQDEILNGMSHGTEGLYSKLNMPLLDFMTDVRVKIQEMERQNGGRESWYN